MGVLARSAPAVMVAVAALVLVGAFPLGCHPLRWAAPPTLSTPADLPASVSEPSPVVPSARVSAPAPAAPAPRPQAHRFAVAAESPTAARVAMDILARGGSAVDAAVAGLLTSGVTHPVSSGLGGGGFAVVWDAKEKRIHTLDFREKAPQRMWPLEMERHLEAKRGLRVGVPGEVAGLFELHARWGKLPLGDAFKAAADVAEGGFPLSAHMARALRWNQKWVLKTPRYAFFAPGGVLLPVKGLVKNPALASTLRRLGAEGRAAFYEGTVAADVVATARGHGSHMTVRDLREYRVVERAPLHVAWEGYDVYTMGPESAGGLMLAETLRMHRQAELTALGEGSGGYLHLLAETFRGAVADRIRTVGDPTVRAVDVERLTSAARMKARRARISLTSTLPVERFKLDEAGTSHFVAVDQMGNVVSVTSTVNNMFGSRLVTSGGFVLNDQLEDFTSRATERQLGIRQGKGPNSPRGGVRPASSMTPTIVLAKGAPILALGGSGGSKVPAATTQVLLSVLGLGKAIGQAIEAPRIDVPSTGGLTIDPGVSPALIDDLARRGEIVEASTPNFSAVQAIAIGAKDGARFLDPFADPRKGGVALVQ